MSIKLKKACGILLAVIMAISLFPASVSAEWYNANKTDYESLDVYNSPTNSKKLTANSFSTFDLGYTCVFTNAESGELEVKNTAIDHQSFLVSKNTSFINNGTVSIDGLFNFGCEGTFTNNGTLSLNNVQNFMLDGFTNNGTVYYDDDINVYALEKIRNQTSAGGRVLAASGVERYSLSYDLNAIVNGSDVSYRVNNDENPTEYTYSYNSGSKTITLKSPKRTGYTFIGWTGDNISTPTVNASFETKAGKNLTFTAHWTLDTYSISYDLDGGSFTEPDSVMTSYTYEDEIFALPSVYRQGYIFQGWTGSNGTAPETPVYIQGYSTGNRSYKANWAAADGIAYTVVRHYEKTDGTYTSEETGFEGTTGTTASADPDSYAKTGFTFNQSLSTVSGEITADGKLKLELYYDRNIYTVEFRSYDGSSLLWKADFKYGQQIKYNGTVPAMDDENNTYTFAGWSSRPEQKTAMPELPPAAENMTFYAAFSKTEKFASIVWVEHTGFKLPADLNNKVNFNSEYKVSLELENEYYCIGTKEWSYPLLQEWNIYSYDEGGNVLPLSLGKDYTITQAGYGEPVVLTIPKVERSLNIVLDALYHDEHRFLTTSAGSGKVKHFCYYCGKTLEHTLKDKYSYDENGHWYECSECSEAGKIDYAKHSYGSWVITVPATSETDGKKERRCTECGYIQTAAATDNDKDGTGNCSNSTKPDNNAYHADLDLSSKDILNKIPLTPEELEEIRNGEDLTVYMVVIDCSANVSDEEKALAQSILTDGMQIGMYIDVSLFKKVGNNAPKPVTQTNGDLKITFEMPESLISADNNATRKYSIVRVHNGKPSLLECSYYPASKKCSFETDCFSTYAIAYSDTEKSAAAKYPIIVSGAASVDRSTAEAGETVNIRVGFGYDAIVRAADGHLIAKITENGRFTMPESGVIITVVQNDTLALMSNAWNHSYVYSYDSDMNRIKVNSDTKRGIITIDLGADYAGRSFTVYSGRKSTSKKIISGVLDENGRYTFNAEEGKNYTLVVE